MTANAAKLHRGDYGAGRGRLRSGAGSGIIDWVATLADSNNRNRRRSGAPVLSHLHYRCVHSRDPEFWLVLLDTSGSLLARGAMAKAKGVVADLCRQAYLQRRPLELIGFGGDQVVPVQAARKPPRDMAKILDSISTGGGTPLRRALNHACVRLKQQARRNRGQARRLILFTDARSRDSLDGISVDAKTHVIDTEQSTVRLGRSRSLATLLCAEYSHIDSLPLR